MVDVLLEFMRKNRRVSSVGAEMEETRAVVTLIHVLIGGEQLPEIANSMEPLLVVAHSGFHQQTRDAILHLHHLAH